MNGIRIGLLLGMAGLLATVSTFLLHGCPYLSGFGESLAGVDANHDGVRDDVERFIDENYSTEKIRIVAREFHRAIQEQILNPENYDPNREYRASDCLYFILDHETAGKITSEIEARTANTRRRIKAYWKANARMSGTIVPGIKPRPEACSFDKRILEKK